MKSEPKNIAVGMKSRPKNVETSIKCEMNLGFEYCT